MPNLRPVPLTSTNQASSWQNLIQRTVQSQNVIAGSGLRAGIRTGDFTEFQLNTEPDADHLVWRGNFDVTAEYQINDVVRVVPNVVYRNAETSASLPIGATSEEGHTVIPISLGLFVCVRHVPPSWANESFFWGNVIQSFPTTVPYEWQDGIRWPFNVYYPVYPEIPSQYTASVNVYAGEGFSTKANDTFWQAMPFGTMPMRVCQDGTAKTFYVIGAESGSVFRTDYLPYTG